MALNFKKMNKTIEINQLHRTIIINYNYFKAHIIVISGRINKTVKHDGFFTLLGKKRIYTINEIINIYTK